MQPRRQPWGMKWKAAARKGGRVVLKRLGGIAATAKSRTTLGNATISHAYSIFKIEHEMDS
jgi:hypothetical protein